MKIDTTQIPNFDSLPEEAKIAIMGMEFADLPDMSKYVEKTVFDRKAAEAAEASRKLREKMTDDEKKASEDEAKWKEVQEKIAQLEAEKLEASYKTKFLALGYDEELATETAKAMAAGDMTKVFESQRKFSDATEARIRSEAIRATPHPSGSGGSDGKTEPSRALQIAQDYQKNLYGE